MGNPANHRTNIIPPGLEKLFRGFCGCCGCCGSVGKPINPIHGGRLFKACLTDGSRRQKLYILLNNYYFDNYVV